MRKKNLCIVALVFLLVAYADSTIKGDLDFTSLDQNDYKSSWSNFNHQSLAINRSCLELINEKADHFKGISNIVKNDQECHPFTNISTTNGLKIYSGKLDGSYEVIGKIQIKDPTIFLIQKGNNLSILAVGVIAFPGISIDGIKTKKKNVVVHISNNNEITVRTFDKINFKPSWVDTNLVQIQGFENRKIQFISRYNINYFTNLHFSKYTRLSGTEKYFIIQDQNSTFNTVYANMELSENRHYQDVKSEMLILGKEFLGVYMGLEKIEMRHLMKMILPSFLHRCINLELEANLILLRGPIYPELTSHHKNSKEKPKLSRKLLTSIVYDRMIKHQFYNGLLVEMLGVIPPTGKLPLFIYPRSLVKIIVKYSKMLKFEIQFHRENETNCMFKKEKSWSVLRKMLRKVKKLSSSKKESSTSEGRLHPDCGKDQYLLQSIEIEIDPSRLMDGCSLAIGYLNGEKYRYHQFKGNLFSCSSVLKSIAK